MTMNDVTKHDHIIFPGLKITPKFGQNEQGHYVYADYYGQTQYLQTNNTWGFAPYDSRNKQYTGYFQTKELAENTLKQTGTPTKQLPPIHQVCKICHQIDDVRDTHKCPTAKYETIRNKLIHEAVEKI